MMYIKIVAVPVFFFLFFVCQTGLLHAEPEIIKTGIFYYAEDYEEVGRIKQIGTEKNLEEVFKNYRYYEAAYDDRKRVILFRSYKRGDIEWEEHYTYDLEGKLTSVKTVEKNKPEKIESFP